MDACVIVDRLLPSLETSENVMHGPLAILRPYSDGTLKCKQLRLKYESSLNFFFSRLMNRTLKAGQDFNSFAVLCKNEEKKKPHVVPYEKCNVQT